MSASFDVGFSGPPPVEYAPPPFYLCFSLPCLRDSSIYLRVCVRVPWITAKTQHATHYIKSIEEQQHVIVRDI